MAGNVLVFDLVIWMLIVSGMSMACLGYYGKRFVGRVPAATPYVLIMFAASAWSILYTLDLLSASLPQKVLFHNLRFLFLPFFSVLELWLVVAYVRKAEWLRLDWALAVLVIPALASVLALTSPFHQFFRYNFSLDTAGPVPVLHYSESLFYQFYNIYSFLLLGAAILILVSESRRSRTVWEVQTLLLLVALAFPTLIGVLFSAGMTPVPGVNMTPALLWIPAILYTLALFRYRFLDVIPVARSRLIETMNAPVIVLDPDGRVLDLNPAASGLLSTAPGSATGKDIAVLAASSPGLIALCRSAAAARTEFTWNAGGTAQYFQGSGEMLLTPAGHPEGRLVMLQDITDLKHAEQALRESEEKFSKAFISSPYAIAITRMDDGLILDVNDGFGRITGYSPPEVVGKKIPDLQLWADPGDRDALVRDLRDGTRVYSREYQFRTKEGRAITGLFSADIIVVQGREYILSSINDVTDRKVAEEQRENLIRELELRNAELDRFTHTVSHDLRNPLFTIKGFLEMLKDDLEAGDLPMANADISKISIAADKMEDLLTTLLALSRSGKSIETPVPVSLSDIARETAELLDASLRNHNVDLVIPGSLPIVMGDRQRLLQVMLNLIDNAVKFMGDQERPVVEVGARDEDGGTVFFVRDNGMGIGAEDIGSIFGLFKRLDTGVPGSGIGLATVRRIIEVHGGKVWAESGGPGKGTTICFTLPGPATTEDRAQG